MKLTKVHHIAIICSDCKRSVRFYTEVLGLKVLSEHYRAGRNSWKVDLALGDDYVVELFSFVAPPSRVTNPEAAGLRHIAFETDDIDAAAAELDAKGVAREEMRTDEYTGRKFFFLRDPDDLPIEIYGKKAPSIRSAISCIPLSPGCACTPSCQNRPLAVICTSVLRPVFISMPRVTRWT